MCTGIEVAMVVSSVLSVAAGAATAIHGEETAANQAEANANFQNAQAQADAAAAQGRAQVEAERIRRAGAVQQGVAIAAAAASGVDVNSVSAVKINETIKHNAEEDAYMTIQQGDLQAAKIRQGGAVDVMAGNASAAAYGNQETGTLISAAGKVASIASNWKTSSGGGG